METKPNDRSPKERETVLIIKGNGEKIFEKLANPDSIPRFTLRSRPRKLIRDTYFDTPQRMLLRNQANLRLREADGQTLITAKSASKTDRSGISSREEIEMPWSPEAISSINRRLGLKIPNIEQLNGSSERAPIDKLKEIGLEIIQQRETRRDPSEIFQGKDNRPIAELALDKVTYHFGDRKIPVFEIEVEARPRTEGRTLNKVRTEIESLDRENLSPWKHGKFVTGRAIEKLLRKGGLEDTDDQRGLGPSTLKKIDRLIGSKEFKKDLHTY